MLLPIGQYFGSSVRQHIVNDLTLTLSHYGSTEPQPWHTHENPTLFLVMQGGLRDHLRHSTTDLETMCLVYHPIDQEHRSEAGPQGLIGLNIELSANWLSTYHLSPTDLGTDTVLPCPIARLGALRLALRVFAHPDVFPDDRETDAFEIITRMLSPHLSRREPTPPRWLRHVESFLQESHPSRISLRDAAWEADVHPVHLARVFRRHYGCSVGDYIRKVRLLHAADSVMQRRSNLGDAAHEAGFADQAHFTRLFRRETGITPKALRDVQRLS